MPEPSLLLTFILATTILMLTPGPNVALIVANAVAWGTRYGLLTVTGTAAAMVVQLGLTALGMSAALGALAAWFEWLRWLGVGYLLWLGVRQWRAPPIDLTRIPAQPRSARGIALRGFLVSLTNPKTLLFYGAFLPQFVSLDRPGPAADRAAVWRVPGLGGSAGRRLGGVGRTHPLPAGLARTSAQPAVRGAVDVRRSRPRAGQAPLSEMRVRGERAAMAPPQPGYRCAIDTG